MKQIRYSIEAACLILHLGDMVTMLSFTKNSLLLRAVLVCKFLQKNRQEDAVRARRKIHRFALRAPTSTIFDFSY